jgi:CBS domain-containing protein
MNEWHTHPPRVSSVARPRRTRVVKDIMSRNPCVCNRSTSIAEVAGLMRKLNIGMIPISAGKEIQGTVTDRDITVRAMADGLDPFSTPAAHVMSTGMIFCYEDQNLRDASALMEDHKVRRLLVLNRQERFVGVVSLGDIASKGSDPRLAGSALREISQPYPLHMSQDEHVEEPLAATGLASSTRFESRNKELELAN